MVVVVCSGAVAAVAATSRRRTAVVPPPHATATTARDAGPQPSPSLCLVGVEPLVADAQCALMNCGRGCGPLRKLRTLRSGYLGQKNTIRQWPVESNAKMRSKKVFNFGVFLVQWSVGTFFGSHFSVRLHWRIVFIGSDSHFEVFLVFLTDRTLARNSLTRFPTTQQWQRTARAPLRPL